MVKCWKCRHVMIAYSGEPSSERLFATEVRKCTVESLVFQRRGDITEEHECEDFVEAKNKFRYEQVEAIRKEMFYIG